MHFGIPRRIFSNRDTRFLNAISTALWEKMDRVEEVYNIPSIDRWAKKVVNKTLVQILRGYNQKHPNTWDKNLVYIQHS